MSRFNKVLLVANIAAIAALVLVVTVYAWNGPGASPPTGGGALGVATNAAANSIYINASGQVGIGVGSSPGYNLDVAGTGATTARIGTGGATVLIGSTSGATLNVGGGAGKVNAGTIDPIYTIGLPGQGGARYASYMAGMMGVKEETTGVAKLQQMANGTWQIVMDFNKLERGSDLWLFWQTTDFGQDWERLSVLLTPGFDGRVWYEKKPGENKLIFYADKAGEISYRLTAARFDHEEWPNASDAEEMGFVLDEK